MFDKVLGFIVAGFLTNAIVLVLANAIFAYANHGAVSP